MPRTSPTTARSTQHTYSAAPTVREHLFATDLFVTCNRNLVLKVSEKQKTGRRSAPPGSAGQFRPYVTLQVALGGSKGRLVITLCIELADDYNATVNPLSNVFSLPVFDAAMREPFALGLLALAKIVQAVGGIIPP